MTKIAAFEVREDESLFFPHYASRNNLEITYFKQPLDIHNVDLVSGYQGITTLGHSRIDATLMDALKKRGIQQINTRTVGTNHFDVRYANKLNIKISNASYPADGVAEFTIMMMLLVLRKYKQAMYRANVNDYSLKGLAGKELKKCTVGVIGTGAIGTAVIKLLNGFGCKVVAFARNGSLKKDLEGYASIHSLEEVYKMSDIISLHIPLNDDTKHFIDKDAISIMKKGVVLVNSSRGSLMNVHALIEGIESEKIGGLAMDVFENESNIYHKDRRFDIISNREMAYLRQFPNVVMTQHMAFFTEANTESMVATSLASFNNV